jgi:SAM-dependent methyltransferase
MLHFKTVHLAYSGRMDSATQTIDTYNKSAKELAEKFRGIGARTDDIELALDLAGVGKDARVVEIGCGDGRDAEEIVQRVAWYEGVDPSDGLLDIAKSRLPETLFITATATSYDYPDNLDVVYAFASLLHVDREDLKSVFSIVALALNEGGIFYISLKERSEYTEELQEDQFGTRTFYYYNPAVIKEIAGESFESVHEGHQTIGSTDWFTIALKKK